MEFNLIWILGLIALLVLWTAWIVFEFIRLKRQVNLLSENLNSLKRDMAGLCTAAVAVDSRLTGANDLLHNLAEKLAEYESVPDSDESYNNAIQRVKQGANADELINSFGLSRDEANLLIRLHGN